MAKDAVINCRIESALKKDAEVIMSRLGIKPSEVINMLYRQITLRKGLPFEVAIPESQESLEESEEKYSA